MVATRLACASCICTSRYRCSLSRASASARFCSVRSSTKATPWSRCSSNAAAPISTGTRLPSLRKYSFSTGGERPVNFNPSTDQASDLGFALFEIAVQTSTLQGDRRLRGEQLQHSAARRREHPGAQVVLEIKHASELGLGDQGQAEN